MREPSANDMMEAYALDTVDFARERFQTSLDFSEESLHQVERILGQLYDTIPRGLLAKMLRRGPSDEQLTQMSTMFGGYVGEVIRRQWGGEWSFESLLTPDPLLTLHIDQTEIYPQAKVLKRLTNGAEDNIWIYYQVLKSRF